MRTSPYIASALLLILLSACFPVRVTEDGEIIDRTARSEKEGSDQPAVTASADPDTDLLRQIGALDRRTLDPGECGVFLWSRIPERQLVLFSALSGDTAVMKLNGRERILKRTEARGERMMGLFTYQRFIAGDFSSTLNITVERRDGLANGAMEYLGLNNIAHDQDDDTICHQYDDDLQVEVVKNCIED